MKRGYGTSGGEIDDECAGGHRIIVQIEDVKVENHGASAPINPYAVAEGPYHLQRPPAVRGELLRALSGAAGAVRVSRRPQGPWAYGPPTPKMFENRFAWI